MDTSLSGHTSNQYQIQMRSIDLRGGKKMNRLKEQDITTISLLKKRINSCTPKPLTDLLHTDAFQGYIASMGMLMNVYHRQISSEQTVIDFCTLIRLEQSKGMVILIITFADYTAFIQAQHYLSLSDTEQKVLQLGINEFNERAAHLQLIQIEKETVARAEWDFSTVIFDAQNVLRQAVALLEELDKIYSEVQYYTAKGI